MADKKSLPDNWRYGGARTSHGDIRGGWSSYDKVDREKELRLKRLQEKKKEIRLKWIMALGFIVFYFLVLNGAILTLFWKFTYHADIFKY